MRLAGVMSMKRTLVVLVLVVTAITIGAVAIGLRGYEPSRYGVVRPP